MNILSHKLAASLTILALVLTACGGGEDSDSTNEKRNDTPPEGQFEAANDLIGEWVYIDSSREFYLNRYNDFEVLEVGDGLIKIDKGDNIDRFALRSGNSASRLTGLVSQVSSNSQPLSTFATRNGYRTQGLSGIGGIDVILQNVNNPDVTVETTTDDDGQFDADIPTGEYDVSISKDNETFDGSVDVSGLGTDAGVLHIADADGYNFKSELNLPRAYGNLEELRGNVKIYNIGSVRGTGLSYFFDCQHELIASCEIDTRSQSIDPGRSISFPITIRFNYLTQAKETIGISSRIRDINGREWQDTMNIDVYKRDIKINVQSEFSSVAGYVILPGHELLPFNASRSTIALPYLPGQEYQLVMANTSISNETPYSIAINTATQSLADFTDTAAFEPNDTETEAEIIPPGDAITAFLHVGDIDYYRVSMPQSDQALQDTAPEFYAITAIYDRVAYPNETSGNGDQVFNTNENIRFDLAVRNKGFSGIKGLNITLSSDDSFVTISNVREQSFDIPARGVSDSDGFTEGHRRYGELSSSADFSAKIAADTPVGHQATVNMTMEDDYGNQWQDSFTITVEQIAAQIVVSDISPFYDRDSSTTRGNDDGTLNPGETVRFSLAIANTGTVNTESVLTTISTQDPYITIDDSDADRRFALGAATVIDTEGNDNNESDFLQKTSAADFRISVSGDTPPGHEATFTATFTDLFGNQWRDDFKMTVAATAANLEFEAISALYDTPYNSILSGNNNSVLSAGETAGFSVAIKNTGTSSTQDVLIDLSTTDTYISAVNWFSASYRTINSIAAGTKEDNNDNVSGSSQYLSRRRGEYYIFAAPNAPIGHKATVNLRMTDKYGNVWTDVFTVEIGRDIVDLEVAGISPFYDQLSRYGESSGNGDSVFNSGEAVRFEMALLNKGNKAVNNVSVALSSNDPHVTVHVANGATSDFDLTPNLALDSDGNNANHANYLSRNEGGDYIVTAAADTPAGHTATINVAMTTQDGTVFNDNVEITVE
ncbi:MAG: hypothetical protein MK185_14900 [Saccharospirillaceae bacterium]|nr:hypothetical protein [Saccharospirillaceae bacterium]